MKAKKRKIKLIAVTVIIIIAVLFISSGIYVMDYYHADAYAAEALVEDTQVHVEQQKNQITFSPETEGDVGLIFYPGGKVEYTAYAPLLHKLAENGVLCVLVKMPCNLAVLDINAADEVLAQYPQITHWYLAGHSLGGSMAASYGAKHTDAIEGLVLLAAYSTEDLKDSGLSVLSIYGSEDGVLNMEKYESYRENLPDTLTEVVIQGGNHAGFGSYGAQDGDGKAAITQTEQMEKSVEEIVNMIK